MMAFDLESKWYFKIEVNETDKELIFNELKGDD